MTTRKSTPKYEVYHVDSGVCLSGVSKAEATQIARAMNKGTKIKRLWVRAVKR